MNVCVLDVHANGVLQYESTRVDGLEAPNRLVIEFGEERACERSKTATRTLMKIMPQ